ncbi:MAG: YlzJ-like family protein [Bacillota bacterium]
MVLYTIYPQEVIFQVDEPRNYFSVDFDGKTFIMEFSNGQARIIRLISSNPQDYLNPKWQPGAKLGFTIPDK